MLLVGSLVFLFVTCNAQFLGPIAERALGRPQNADVSKHPNWNLLNSRRCGLENSDPDRIIGGVIARFGELPWIARIGYSGPGLKEISYRCGGAVINNDTILTAAHCVTGLPRDFLVAAVQVGEYNTRTDPDCMDDRCAPPVQVLKPRQIIIHSEYNTQPFKNDIALIRVANMKVDGAWVTPICVLNGGLTTENFVGKILKVSGWGIYNISDPKNSDDLMTVLLPVQSNEVCQKEYAKHAPIGPTQMCVGGTKGKDSCGGDSGGPLMAESTQDGHVRQYVIGIVSFGSKKCGETEMPGIYTRLSSFLDWLLDNIKENTVSYKLIQ